MSSQATSAPLLGNTRNAAPASEKRRWAFPRRLSRGVKLLVAATLLVALYSAADWNAVGAALLSLDGAYLAAAPLLFVPQTLLSALRWKFLVSRLQPISVGQAVRHTLAASALNLVVPSKLGDLSKAAMLPRADARVRRKPRCWRRWRKARTWPLWRHYWLTAG